MEFSSRYQAPYYFICLTDMNIRTVIVLFSVHFPSKHTPKSSSDEPLWYLTTLHLILPHYFTSKLTFLNMK